MGIDFSSFYIYRFRYWIGYSLIGVLLLGLLLFAGLYAPGGISNAEMSTVVKSSNVAFTDIHSFAVPNLPYLLLQKTSINLLGVSNFSIKLPSLILAFISAIGLVVLLRRWFKPNIVILASIIAITTGQFLFIAQDGTPGILYVLWSVWLLLLGTLIAKRSKPRTLWKILFFIVGALSLYTPLSIYAMLAMGAAAVLHPHLRYIVRQLSRYRLAIGFVAGLAIVSPIVIGVTQSPELGLAILGIPVSWPDFGNNFLILSQQYLGFWEPSTTGLMTPVFGLGSMLVIVFGAYKLVKTHESTQSYLVIIWLICLVPILVTNPGFTSVTFLPLVLLLATGLDSLLGYWYRLFPHNPYARITGLFPLVILVGALVLSGLGRYIYGYRYDPYTVANFSTDLSLLPKDTGELVVTNDQLPFYQVVNNHRQGLSVSVQPRSETFTATADAKNPYLGYKIDRIITSSTSQNADRFYIYKKTAE
jgi:4-amino-4-deoxy-L-arabinose transferase-like glycosyltransferase